MRFQTIKVLSREPDRSMLGLSHRVSKFDVFEIGLLFAVFVLLHGGGQAGDPAILSSSKR